MAVLLAAPFTDADWSASTLDIVFDVGGGNLTATVSKPSVLGAADGLYCFGDTGADDLAEAVADALTAADAGGTWTAAYAMDGGVLKVTLSRSPGASITIRWTHASTTFDGAWLGYDPTVDSTHLLGTPTADWNPGRLWRCQYSPYLRYRETSQHREAESGTGNGESRTYSSKTSWGPFKAEGIHGTQVWLSDAANSAIVSASGFSGLTAGDPNFPFEGTWKWLRKRKPHRLWPDQSARTTHHRVRVRNHKDVFSDLMNALTPLNDAPPIYTLELAAVTHV